MLDILLIQLSSLQERHTQLRSASLFYQCFVTTEPLKLQLGASYELKNVEDSNASPGRPHEREMGWICYYNLQLCSQPHQSVTFSQIAFWNVKVSTEFWAYLVQPFLLNCKKSGLWIFSVGTAFLIQSLSELLINQPNGKYWKSLLQFRKKAQK